MSVNPPVSVQGFRMNLPDYLGNAGTSIASWEYEANEVWMVRNRLHPGMTAIDLGANVGFYTLLFASLVGPTGRVLAVEPHPKNLKDLEENVRLNEFQNVRLVAGAVSDRNGEGRLYHQPDGGTCESRLWRNGVEWPSFPVLLYTVDDLAHRAGFGGVDLIKMDVQGSEIEVLKGAKATIDRSPRLTMMIEYSPVDLRGAGHEAMELMDFIRRLGFSVYSLSISTDGLTGWKLTKVLPGMVLSTLGDDGKADPNSVVLNLWCFREPEGPHRWSFYGEMR